jgi:hypothetical protein
MPAGWGGEVMISAVRAMNVRVASPMLGAQVCPKNRNRVMQSSKWEEDQAHVDNREPSLSPNCA